MRLLGSRLASSSPGGLVALVLLALATVPTRTHAAPAGVEDVTFFETHIRPLLIEHCYACHSAQAKKIRGGLRLDTEAGWRKGSEKIK